MTPARPELPDLSLEAMLVAQPVRTLTPADLWLDLTPNPPAQHTIKMTFGKGPPPPPILIAPAHAQRVQEYHFLKGKMDTILRITRNMTELHHRYTLPLPNPADPKDPYYRLIAPDNAVARMLRGFKEITKPDANRPEHLDNCNPVEDAVPRLLPLGLYENYRQEMNRKQERRLAEILKLGSLLTAHANITPKQNFPWEENQRKLRRLIEMNLELRPGPTLTEFFASQPSESPQGRIICLLHGKELPGYRTAALYYAAGHAARKLTAQKLSEADTRPQRHRPQRQQHLQSP